MTKTELNLSYSGQKITVSIQKDRETDVDVVFHRSITNHPEAMEKSGLVQGSYQIVLREEGGSTENVFRDFDYTGSVKELVERAIQEYEKHQHEVTA